MSASVTYTLQCRVTEKVLDPHVTHNHTHHIAEGMIRHLREPITHLITESMAAQPTYVSMNDCASAIVKSSFTFLRIILAIDPVFFTHPSSKNLSL
jgi:hypothetical protein